MTMAPAIQELPVTVAMKLAEFCAGAKTGQLQLDIVNGQIVAYKLTEAGRVDRTEKQP